MRIEVAVEEGLLSSSIDNEILIPDKDECASGDVIQLKNGSPRSGKIRERKTALICFI